ncbi:DUF2065 domain-containing protein [Pseudoxanthobacter sp. M-2]|uniref:DUF2065 domain-containing protein n=1 Tax=Pseudoxanthobacter sp. M-2 TaxID=3078754 RepID=UPI0038FCB2FF
MSDLLVAIGLVLAIEGTLYALAPQSLKAMMRAVLDLPDAQLRVAGVGALAVGVLVVWFVRG